ncbi:oxysterol-binding protein-related protein 9 [Folsomia candida]|uniref:oxysterol-binding protein-related protein 9 n=1 Tax=Folsomia candida TaxID=158441 RepID=UPI000B8F2CE2|nr:oxysterol-binding protein-related protein 9 [Folsomia candida]
MSNSGGAGDSTSGAGGITNRVSLGSNSSSSNVTAALMEGVLSKWTNVMKGWQFRWFVLDENTGLLSYYTTKEKMRRGVRRGCIRLQGAVLGIDDEEDSNFTITVDAKVFHLQAKDAEEREIWVRALEETILKHTRLRPLAYFPHVFSEANVGVDEPLHRFELRLAQADSYLALLIQQVAAMESKPELAEVVGKANEFLEAVKHSIVLLQIAKNTAFPVATLASPVILHYSDPEIQTGIEYGAECTELAINSNKSSKVPPIRVVKSMSSSMIGQSPISPNEKSPVFISYSSSDDEQDFFDANEEFESAEESETPTKDNIANLTSEKLSLEDKTLSSSPINSVSSRADSRTRTALEPGLDWDSLYDEDVPEDDLGSVEGHGSVLSHLLSQVKIGMDLTKVVLPTFILERRSLLEMYADFFAHPDMFVGIPDAPTPRDRIVSVLRWYLGAFHAGRRSEVAKKPYNPILGETFQCYWHLKGYDQSLMANKVSQAKALCADNDPKLTSGASSFVGADGTTLFPWVEDQNALVFFGEQVSHHPPISAFYAEHPQKKISLNAHIWTKSKFLGLSIGVQNIGHATLTLHNGPREDYVLGFPNGYARSILTVPWVELGGPVTISCTQTGYNARVEFMTKPFFSGDKNKINAQVFGPEDKKKPFLVVDGEWNGVMVGKWADGRTERFVDVLSLKINQKQTRPIAQQETYESRRMWKDVTRGLKFREIDNATNAKFFLEERQRQEARERSARSETWKPRMFIPAGDTWIFSEPLEQRLKLMQSKSIQKPSEYCRYGE